MLRKTLKTLKTPYNDSKNNIFAIYGHGSEEVIEVTERITVPDGVTIVVFTTCTGLTTTSMVCLFNDIFSNKSYNHLLKDPTKNKNKLVRLFEQGIRIYNSGQYLPEMSTTLFLQYNSRIKSSKVKTLMKSGVYRINDIPIIDKTIVSESQRTLGSSLCNKWSGEIPNTDAYSLKIHNELYKKNIFNDEKIVANYEDLRKNKFKIVDIVNQIGSGVYYYIGCRYVGETEHISPSIFQRIHIDSENQQLRKKKLAIEKKIRTLIDGLNKNRDHLIEDNKKLFNKFSSLSYREKRIAPRGALYLLPDVFYHSFKIIVKMEHYSVKVLHNIIKCLEYLCRKSIEHYSYTSDDVDKKNIEGLIKKSMSDIVESINTIVGLNAAIFFNISFLPSSIIKEPEDKLKEFFYPKKTQKALSPTIAAIIIPPSPPPRLTVPLTRRITQTSSSSPRVTLPLTTRRVSPTRASSPPQTRRTAQLLRSVSPKRESSIHTKNSYILDELSIKSKIDSIGLIKQSLNKSWIDISNNMTPSLISEFGLSSGYNIFKFETVMTTMINLTKEYLELCIMYMYPLQQFYEEASEKVLSRNTNPNAMHIYTSFLYFIKDKTAISKILDEYNRLIKLIKIFEKNYSKMSDSEIKNLRLINPFIKKPQLTEAS